MTAQRYPQKPLPVYKAPWLQRIQKGWILHPPYPRNKSVLFLHGWNFDPLHFFNLCASGNLFLQKGYTIFLPDMGKSVYASQNFPETKFPERPLRKDLTEFLRFVREKHRRFVGETAILFGISTGARGASLLNIDTKDALFSHILLFSGDYCQDKFPQDNLMISAYGEFSQFPERWQRIDNPCRKVKHWQTPTFIAHAKDDRIVPWKHSYFFYRKLQNIGANKLRTWFPERGGHKHVFWNKALEKFFEEVSL